MIVDIWLRSRNLVQPVPPASIIAPGQRGIAKQTFVLEAVDSLIPIRHATTSKTSGNLQMVLRPAKIRIKHVKRVVRVNNCSPKSRSRSPSLPPLSPGTALGFWVTDVPERTAVSRVQCHARVVAPGGVDGFVDAFPRTVECATLMSIYAHHLSAYVGSVQFSATHRASLAVYDRS